MKTLAIILSMFIALAGTLNAKTFTAFILVGQSNSLGAIKGNFADAKKMKPEPKMLFWHKNFGGYCTGPKSTEWGKIEPQNESQIVMGPEYGFGQMMQKKAAKKFPPATTGILKASRDGGGNGEWLKPTGAGWKNLMSAVEESFGALAAKGFDKVEVAALLYLQGESNGGAEIPAAGTRIEEFVENLKTDLPKMKIPGVKISTAKMVALIGEPANWHGKDNENAGTTTVAELKKAVARHKGKFAFVPTRDLPKIKVLGPGTGDNMGVHYDGNAQLKIGERFAEAFLKLNGGK